MRALIYLAYIGLVVYCLADAIQHPDSHPYRLPKWAWIVIILVFPLVGAGAWLLLKFTYDGGQGDGARRDGHGPGGRGTSGPVAPDDDPDYLRWLRDQERRRRQEGKG
ncbi:PLD nuclease N-terminal domain-containing protein [Demequina capsici]|uniref:PLD nuclease N-terminal domain-containing protein n=1 Tax=Demequina capsici TaxID=3075620 RepID=A0AA96J7N7_9MICO|nr:MULTISPECIES: PLD nuclease N-terminal domain-containing protein [unclassified Demequina]WNM24193.1 PLD nuclease N-terminal domain-containing protein [Demequina sp. OYTSA14]WNM27022.1 PLD nuclease N-terminal domain-containing protein [Demequina sp. PMTSA13]